MEYRALDGNIGELKFYGDISEWWINGADFTNTIQKMAGMFKAIHIRAHCYGGSVFEGSVMYNAILRFKTQVPDGVKLFIDGVSASMMSIVMQACDEIEIAENGFVMVHCPVGYCQGNAKQMIATAKLLTNMESNFGKVYASRTGKSAKEVSKWFDGADYWFSAEEALAEGLVTSISNSIIVNIKEVEKPTESGQTETVFNRFAALMIEPITQKFKTENDTMKKDLIAQFGLTGVTENSTEAEILAAVKVKMDGASEAGKTIMKNAVEAVISGVEKATSKTYDAEMRSQLVTVGETSGLETLQAMLGLNTPTTDVTAAAPSAAAVVVAGAAIPKIITMVNGGTVVAETRKDWDWDKWQAEDADGYEALEKSNTELHKALYNAKFKTNL